MRGVVDPKALGAIARGHCNRNSVIRQNVN